jgi:hypothetical protein
MNSQKYIVVYFLVIMFHRCLDPDRAIIFATFHCAFILLVVLLHKQARKLALRHEALYHVDYRRERLFIQRVQNAIIPNQEFTAYNGQEYTMKFKWEGILFIKFPNQPWEIVTFPYGDVHKMIRGEEPYLKWNNTRYFLQSEAKRLGFWVC